MSVGTTLHQTAAGTNLPLINLTGSATLRMGLCEFVLGSDASPGDQAGEYALYRTTDIGTGGTALTPQTCDPVGSAVAATARGGTFGTAPTKAAVPLYMFALHQRSTLRWAALSDKHLFRSVLTASNGLMLNIEAFTSGTPNINATLVWEE